MPRLNVPQSIQDSSYCNSVLRLESLFFEQSQDLTFIKLYYNYIQSDAKFFLSPFSVVVNLERGNHKVFLTGIPAAGLLGPLLVPLKGEPIVAPTMWIYDCFRRLRNTEFQFLTKIKFPHCNFHKL